MLPDLTIKIGVDASAVAPSLENVSKSLESLRRRTDKVARRLNNLGDGLANLGKKMSIFSGGIAAVAGAGFALASSTAATANAIDKQSKSVGLSASAYQELGFAIGQVSDVTEAELSVAFRQLTTRLGQAAAGNETMQDALTNLGLSLEDVKSGSVTTEQAFIALTSAAQKAESPAEAMALAASVLGERAAKLGPILRESGGDIDDLREKAKDLGIVLSDDAVAAGAQFTDKMDEVSRQVGALKDKIGAALLPVMTNQLLPAIQDKVIPALGSMVESISSLIDWFGNLPGPIQEALGVVATAFAVGGPALVAIGVFSKVLGGLILATGPIGLLIGAATLLTAAWAKWGDDIQLLLSDVKKWFEDGFNDTIEWIKTLPDQFLQFGSDVVEGFKEGITAKFEEVKDAILEPFTDISDSVKDFFGISSPSKLFMQYGSWVGEGFANGIAASSDMVSRAVGVMNNAATAKMGEAASSILGSMASVFKGSKPIALAQAAINMWLGATEALKLPFPANLAAFASTVATGIGAIQSIKSTNIGSPSTSGSRGGGGGSGGGGGNAGRVDTLNANLRFSGDASFASDPNAISMIADRLQTEFKDRGVTVVGIAS